MCSFVFSDVCLTQRRSCESYSSLVPRFLCPSVKSLQIPANRCPAIHKPTVANLSLLPLHFCHHPSSAFDLVVPQPSSAEMNTLCRIYNPILTYQTDIREDDNSHKVTQCKYLSRSLCTAVDSSSQMDSCL